MADHDWGTVAVEYDWAFRCRRCRLETHVRKGHPAATLEECKAVGIRPCREDDALAREEKGRESARAFVPGVYRHAKTGDLYSALFILIHHDTRLPWVGYVSHADGVLNHRPLDPCPGEPSGWNDTIEHGGRQVQRFTFIRRADGSPRGALGGHS